MKYYLYKITNNVNGKIYVGVHKTSNLDDGYMGSGRVIKAAIAKYGLENFTKDILEWFEDSTTMYAREKEVVTEEFLARDDVYNLKTGGFGGFDFVNQTRSYESRSVNGKINGAKGSKWTQKLTPSEVQIHMDYMSSFRTNFDTSAAHAASLTEQSRLNRIAAFSEIGHQQGSKNSQYGTMWITDGSKNSKIAKDSTLPDGWYRGRVKVFVDVL